MLTVKRESGLEALVQKYEPAYCLFFVIAAGAACFGMFWIALN